MRKLTLVRHAKSSWAQQGLSDFDRPLNDRGRRDAPVMGRRLKARDLVPAQLLSSPALRALSTAQLFAQEFDVALEDIGQEPAIYDASPKALLQVVRGLQGSGHVMLFGHNPGISEFAFGLAGERAEDMPTCAVAHLVLDVKDWKDAKPGCGKMVYYLFPKDAKK